MLASKIKSITNGRVIVKDSEYHIMPDELAAVNLFAERILKRDLTEQEIRDLSWKLNSNNSIYNQMVLVENFINRIKSFQGDSKTRDVLSESQALSFLKNKFPNKQKEIQDFVREWESGSGKDWAKEYSNTVVLEEDFRGYLVEKGQPAYDRKTRDETRSCAICSSYRKDTGACRVGCSQENVKLGGSCPYDYETDDPNADLQSDCKCYNT